jgi:hypothetical protein
VTGVSEGEQIEVVRAGEEHIQRIAEIAESRSLAAAGHGRSTPEGGFLVSAYTEADYRTRLETAECFYVAVKGTEVLAFLLAYSSDRLEPGEWLNRRLSSSPRLRPGDSSRRDRWLDRYCLAGSR